MATLEKSSESPTDQPEPVGLTAVELAARGCGVFAGYHRAGSLTAVRIIVDNTHYLVWPDESTGAWLVAPPAAGSGADAGPDESLMLTLRFTGNERRVPTYAWARFLTGQPLA